MITGKEQPSTPVRTVVHQEAGSIEIEILQLIDYRIRNASVIQCYVRMIQIDPFNRQILQ